MQVHEAKEVIGVASSFLLAQEPDAKAVRLEQIEERSDGEWSIVLSFPDWTIPAAALLSGAHTGRVYKEVRVSQDKKEVTSLRFWK